MKKFAVRIFDGEYTRIYTVEEKDILSAQNKILKYHKAFGRKVVKVETTKIY